MTRRVSFLIDGFNLYHSIAEVEERSGIGVKWLDIRKMCESLLAALEPQGVLERVFYFTAKASHYGAAHVSKQMAYINAVRSTGVEVIEGSFKTKPVKCRACGRIYQAHEEEKTDVAIAVQALSLCEADSVDTLVWVTGDTDQIPPLQYLAQKYPRVSRVVVFPSGRVNSELRSHVDFSLILSEQIYRSNQFPTVVSRPGKSDITKPPNW